MLSFTIQQQAALESNLAEELATRGKAFDLADTESLATARTAYLSALNRFARLVVDGQAPRE
jgi:hypothetical protein